MNDTRHCIRLVVSVLLILVLNSRLPAAAARKDFAWRNVTQVANPQGHETAFHVTDTGTDLEAQEIANSNLNAASAQHSTKSNDKIRPPEDNAGQKTAGILQALVPGSTPNAATFEHQAHLGAASASVGSPPAWHQPQFAPHGVSHPLAAPQPYAPGYPLAPHHPILPPFPMAAYHPVAPPFPHALHHPVAPPPPMAVNHPLAPLHPSAFDHPMAPPFPYALGHPAAPPVPHAPNNPVQAPVPVAPGHPVQQPCPHAPGQPTYPSQLQTLGQPAYYC